jgi:hypothetical protein
VIERLCRLRHLHRGQCRSNLTHLADQRRSGGRARPGGSRWVGEDSWNGTSMVSVAPCDVRASCGSISRCRLAHWRRAVYTGSSDVFRQCQAVLVSILAL